MAKPESAAELLRQKLSIMNEFLRITQQELLLVNLEGLSPLLDRKDTLIREIARIDAELEKREPPPAEAPQQQEIARLVGAILENERTLEARINEEHSRLRKEIRELDRQTRLREYLERQRRPEAKIDLKE